MNKINVQWSYELNASDPAYNKKKDENYQNYDNDQNFQIETHYQSCILGKEMKFGDMHLIIGDKNNKKNGFNYEVFGSSKKPETWFQQN